MGDRRRVNWSKLGARTMGLVIAVCAGIAAQRKWIDPATAVALGGFGMGLAGTTTRETFRRPERLAKNDSEITTVERFAKR